MALVLAIPLWWITLSQFPHFEIEIVEEGVLKNNSLNVYADFSGDGKTEKVFCYPWQKGFQAFPITRSNGEVVEQYNLRGEKGMYISHAVFTGDYDGNEKQELYVILHKGDSLVLNIIDPIGKGHIVKNRFIGLVKKGKAGYDYDIRTTQFYDVNDDGKKELVFLISAGFSIYPRCVFLYDIVNDNLRKSDHLGAYPHELRISDINSDGEPEFVITNFASANMSPPLLEYNDQNAYLWVLDKKLNPLFPPKVFEGATQFIKIFPFTSESENYWGVFHKCASNYEEIGRLFYLLNYKGEIIKKQHYKYKGYNSYLTVIPVKENNKDGALVYKRNKNLYRLDHDLNLKKITKFDEGLVIIKKEDLDHDGEDEVVMLSRKGRYIYVFRNDFKNYVKTEIKCIPSDISTSLVIGKYNESALYFQAGNTWFDLIYRKVSYYYLKSLVLILGIYLAMSLLVWIIQHLTAGRDRRRKQMAELQLSNWKNQLDPHFTFNTLNSVGAVILTEDRDKAYDFFTRFSKLVRYALEASNRVSVSLNDEIHFIELYLQLEQFRFDDKFKYTIEVANDISRATPVPKMLLQTYVENAVRHGLMDRDNKGLLLINISSDKHHHVFQVIDNGIGRLASSRKRRLSNGIGMKAMQDYFNLLNSINRKNISIDIGDFDETNSKYPGTVVTIKIPNDFSYEL